MHIHDSDIPVFVRRRRPCRDIAVAVLSHVYSVLLLAVLYIAFAMRMMSGGFIRYTRLHRVPAEWLWLVDYDYTPPFWVQWAHIRYIDAIYDAVELHYPVEP